jgi:toxin ParE1/3/4
MNNLPKTKPRVEFSSHSLTDLEEIWTYLAEVREKSADKILKNLLENCSRTLVHPKMGRQRNELTFGLRSFPVSKYMIFYQQTDFGIEIVRVLHSSRDIPQVFNEMIPLKP